MAHPDYEVLVAAHLMRNPSFCADYGALILATEGRFFADFFLRDPATYTIRMFLSEGYMLPPEAIKTDVQLFRREGASGDNYDEQIDRVWAIPDTVLETSRQHVENTIVRETQLRMIQGEDLDAYCTPSRLAELWKRMEEIRTLGASRTGEPRLLGEGLLDLLSNPPAGVPTGIDGLDEALSGGGVCPGETLLWFGRWAIGKSIILHHTARSAATAGRVVVLWSFETSEATTRIRLIKGLLGLTDEEVRSDPSGVNRRYHELMGDCPLFVHYSPSGSVTKADIGVYLDRVEQKIGRKVELLALDYSEKRAKGRDWNQVCDAYQELREICGERQIAGVDVAQEGRGGEISYYNLLKDADIGVQLTVDSPEEWRRRQRRGGDEEIVIPTEGPVWGEVRRAREGKSGDIFQLWVNREKGTVTKRDLGVEEE